MILQRLSSRNFRNLAPAEWQFHPSANVLVGDNGQGKTNLLEAIYFLATTRSFRVSRPDPLMRFGVDEMFVEGVVEKESIAKTLSIGMSRDSRRREMLLNGQKATLHEYLRVLTLFDYSASRLEIIRGAPEERRRFLDRGIATLRPGYLKELSRYSSSLKQRNALIQSLRERKVSAKELDAWDREFSAAAAAVVLARREYVNLLGDAYREVVRRLEYHVDRLAIRYEPAGFDSGPNLEQNVDALQSLRKREVAAGFSLAGPHRDSILFELPQGPAAQILSGGELKTTVLFLKLAKIGLFKERFEEAPLFLLDDVDAELDQGILERLMRHLIGSVQLFTTSAKASFFPSGTIGEHRRFAVRRGEVGSATDFPADRSPGRP